METQTILNNSSLTKTEKIRQLLALGLSRREVANLTGGNYGFVQNVFARYWPELVQSRTNRTARVAAASFGFTEFNRRFGVEIEAYNVDRSVLASALRAAGINAYAENYNHLTQAHWKIVTDGSLNGNSSFELVSPVLEGMAGLEELRKVCQVLKAKNAYINRSCGLHIHFDARAMNVNQVKNLICNYAHFEGLIDNFMPVSRRNNTYCATLNRLAAQTDTVTTIEGLARLQGTRYQKVNLQSYARYQTVEFRQHSGTIEFSKISNWILFLHNLTEFSRTTRANSRATFEALSGFQQAELITYYHNRTNELAA